MLTIEKKLLNLNKKGYVRMKLKKEIKRIYLIIFIGVILLAGCRDKVKIIHPSDKIVIIGIDDKSIEAIGKWRWSRDNYAKLLRKLRPLKPKVIYFDLLFDEIMDIKKDREFAEEIKKAGNVFLHFFLITTNNCNYKNLKSNIMGNEEKLSKIIFRGKFYHYYSTYFTYNKIILPHTIFSSPAKGFFAIHGAIDKNNISAASELFSIFCNEHNSYANKINKIILIDGEIGILINYYNINMSSIYMINSEKLVIGKAIIPVKGEYLTLKFTELKNTYKIVSFIDVLRGNYKKDLFKDKIVLIGTMSEKAQDKGRIDRYNTPVGKKYGVELIADGINTLMYYYNDTQ